MNRHWHGASNDMGWYEAMAHQPLYVRFKKHIQLKGSRYKIHDFIKIDDVSGYVKIKHNGYFGEMYVTFNEIQDMSFKSDSQPITARQAFNLYQFKNGKFNENRISKIK